MSLLTPKTIVITTVPGKSLARPVTIQTPTDLSDMEDIYCGQKEGGPRKRRRLTHLTPEEKMMRRKLKNRVAAQTARDRKKALMSDLETQLAQVMEENKRLQRENENLKQKSTQLISENSVLKERLGTVDGTLVKTEKEASGSAVSFVTLPQGQTQSPSQPMMPYAVSVLTLSLYLALHKKLEISPEKLQEVMSNLLTKSQLSQEVIENIDPLLKWWGRHQQNWNPSMNS